MRQSIVDTLADERFAGLEATLARLGADYSAVVRTVDTAVGLGPQHVLLGVGSVAEGLGTSKSDFDLLLITDDDAGADAGVVEAEHAWLVGRCVVDLRTLRLATVTTLLSRLRDWARGPWDTSKAVSFTLEERVLLHRLLHGVQLFPEHRQPPRFSFRPPSDELARLKLQVARHLMRTIQVDMAGYRDSADYCSLMFAAQELLGHAVDGLLAAHRVTNPTPKWRSRLLAGLPAGWSDPLAIRPTRLPADRLFWELHRAPAEPDPEPVVVHATRCVSFARAVFAWAEPRLVAGSAAEAVVLPWSPDRSPSPDGADGRRSPGRTLPTLELDVDFRMIGAQVAVGRLNEFGGSLTITPQELAVLLLFDGQTSFDEAASVCAGLAGNGSKPVDVERLIEAATAAGLCAWRPQHQPAADT